MHHQGGPGMQEVIQMCSSFDATKSTKGASKLRRDLINAEIANLRDLLPLPSSTRQRLSQLQLMALVCVYVRKANYFQQVFKRYHELGHPYSTPNIGFSKALSGFLIMMTQNGKLLYISDNAAEYLGHSMEDLLIHGDSVYDIIDKADHGTVQAELLRNSSPQNPPGEETRLFLCRMNVSRNARRQMRFGDQKVVLLQGHYLSYLPLCSRNEPVFVGSCTPVAMPETRECVVQGATNVFTTIHAMDMKFMHVDRNGEYYLGYSRSELGGISWYQLVHWNYMREAQSKHRLISQSEQEKSCILLLRLQTRCGDWIWVHCVLQVKDGSESSNSQQQQPTQSVIVATNQVLSEREASVMRANSWLYHYYTVQTKLQYGLAYPEAPPGSQGSPSAAAAAARLAAAAYFPSPQLMNYSSHPHMHPHHQLTSDSFTNYTATAASLQQPHHNGGTVATGYASPYHPHSHHPHHHHPIPHHHHPYAHSFGQEGGKESPLDFSLAASSATPTLPFEFQMSASPYSAGSSYWSHHHSHHLSPGSNPHTHAHSLHHHSSAAHQGYGSTSSGHKSAASEGSSATVSPSASSPQIWSLSTNLPQQTQNHLQQNPHSTTLRNSNATNNNNHTSNSAVTPTRTTSGNNGGSPRKKAKKGQVVAPEMIAISETSSPPALNHHSNGNSRSFSATNSHHHQSNNSHSNNLSPNNNGSMGHESSESSVGTLTSSAPFPYHMRHRSVYKLFNSPSDSEDHSTMKEESLSMACPLTPSPIWEGQTHRVPDLQHLYSNMTTHHHGGGGGNSSGTGGNNGSIINGSGGSIDRDSHGSIMSGTDLIHCVPTYQPYFSAFAPGTAAAVANGLAAAAAGHYNHTGGYNFNNAGQGIAGTGFGMAAMGYLQTSGQFHLMSESGSPNKENRLPPTPESENGENEENKPIKWESL